MVHDSDVDEEEDYEPESHEEEDEQSHIGRFNGRGQQDASQVRFRTPTRKPSTPIRKSTGNVPFSSRTGVRQVSIDPKSGQGARTSTRDTKN